jgi:hypothetical protein
MFSTSSRALKALLLVVVGELDHMQAHVFEAELG